MVSENGKHYKQRRKMEKINIGWLKELFNRERERIKMYRVRKSALRK